MKNLTRKFSKTLLSLVIVLAAVLLVGMFIQPVSSAYAATEEGGTNYPDDYVLATYSDAEATNPTTTSNTLQDALGSANGKILRLTDDFVVKASNTTTPDNARITLDLNGKVLYLGANVINVTNNTEIFIKNGTIEGDAGNSLFEFTNGGKIALDSTVKLSSNIPYEFYNYADNHLELSEGYYSLKEGGVVAYIQSTKYGYGSLANAAGDLKDGDTIHFIKDSLSIATAEISKTNVTIDLDGHTVKYDGSDFAVKLADGVNVTINGETAGSAMQIVTEANGLFYLHQQSTLTVNGGTYSGDTVGTYGLFYVGNKSEKKADGNTINLNNVTASTNYSVYTSVKDNAGIYYVYTTLNVTGGTYERVKNRNDQIEGSPAGTERVFYLSASKGMFDGVKIVSDWGTCVEVSGPTASFGGADIGATVLKGANDFKITHEQNTWSNSAVAASWGGQIVIEDGTYEGVYALFIYSSGGAIDVKGGKFVGRGGTAAEVRLDPTYNTTYNCTADLAISGGNFTGTVAKGSYTQDDLTVAVSGGTFSEQIPYECLAEGYVWAADGVKEGSYVAYIKGGYGYASLADAIDAAQAGQTVVLLADAVEISVAADKNIKLDLNGYNVTSGTAKKAAIANYGTLELINSSDTMSTITRNGAKWYVVFNEGTLTFNSDNITVAQQAGDGSSAVINNWDCDPASPAKLIINKGNFTSDSQTVIKNDEYGVLTITGGTFGENNTNYFALLNWGEATITGGEFNALGGVAVGSYSYHNETSKLTITGGTFNADEAVRVRNDEDDAISVELAISGGTFNGAINANSNPKDGDSIAITGGVFAANNVYYAYLPADKHLAVNDEGKYVIVDGGLVAAIGEVGYFTLAEAIAAAQDGETVVLLADVETTEKITIEKDITLDFDEHTYTANLNGGFAFTVKNAAVTFANGTIKSNIQGILADENAKITLSGVTVESANQLAVYVAKASAIAIIEEDSTLKATNYALYNVGGTSIVDGNIEATETCAIFQSGGAVTISDTATLKAKITTVYANGGNLVIDGATIISENVGSGSAVYLGGGNTTEIKNGAKLTAGQIGLYVEDATATIENANIEAAIGISVNGVQGKATGVTMNGGAVKGSANGVVIWGTAEEADDTSVYFTMNGGKVESQTYQAISGNGSAAWLYNTAITLTGDAVVEAPSTTIAIYQPQVGALVINGDAQVTGGTGIYAKAGSVEVSGNAKVSATGAYTAPVVNGNGATNSGDAIVVDSHSSYKGVTSLVVKDNATLTSANGYAVYEVATKGNAQVGTMALEDGTYNSEKGVYSENVTKFVSGGTFGANVLYAYLANDKAAKLQDNGTYAIGAAVEDGVSYYAAYVVDGYGYTTLAQAVAAAQAGDTIEVLRGETLTAPVEIKKALTINFNGQTYTADAGYLFKVYVSLAIDNVMMTNANGYGIVVNHTENDTSAIKVSITNAEIKTSQYAVVANSEGVEVTIGNGTVITSEKTGATYSVTVQNKAVVNIEGNATITATNGQQAVNAKLGGDINIGGDAVLSAKEATVYSENGVVNIGGNAHITATVKQAVQTYNGTINIGENAVIEAVDNSVLIGSKNVAVKDANGNNVKDANDKNVTETIYGADAVANISGEAQIIASGNGGVKVDSGKLTVTDSTKISADVNAIYIANNVTEVAISGNAQISAVGNTGINANSGKVTLSDNVQVSADINAVYAGADVELIIEGGKINAETSNAVHANGAKVTIEGETEITAQGQYAIFVVEGAEVAIGGKANVKAGSRAVYVRTDATVTINGEAKITAETYTVRVDGTATIGGEAQISANNYIAVQALAGSVVTVGENAALTAKDQALRVVANAQATVNGNATLTATGGEDFNGDAIVVVASDNHATETNLSIGGNVVVTAARYALMESGNGTDPSCKYEILGGTFTSESGILAATVDKFASGGTFNKAIAIGYIADGYHLEKNSDGTYTIKEGAIVVVINDEFGYATLQAAIDAAEATDEIVITADAEAEITTATIAKEITLKVADGVTAKGNITVEEGGKLTIDGGAFAGEISSKGTLTINDGTYTGAIKSEGTLAILGGEFGIGEYDPALLEISGNAAISGGKFDCAVEISGGETTISGTAWFMEVMASNAKVTLAGGKGFNSEYTIDGVKYTYEGSGYIQAGDNAEVTMTNGDWEILVKGAGASATVDGGVLGTASVDEGTLTLNAFTPKYGPQNNIIAAGSGHGGTLVINGGEYAAVSSEGCTVTFGGNATTKYLTATAGTINVEGGTVTGEVNVESGATLNIKGGTFGGEVINHGTLNISDGTLNGAIESDGTLTISGGTLNGAITSGGSLAISGGNINNSSATLSNVAEKSITGGQFTASNYAAYEPYVDYDNYHMSDTYEVVPGATVAKIGNVGYAYLLDAVKDAANGEIVLMANIDSTNIEEGKTVTTANFKTSSTVNLNGKKIDATISLGMYSLTVNGEGEITAITKGGNGTLTINGGTIGDVKSLGLADLVVTGGKIGTIDNFGQSVVISGNAEVGTLNNNNGTAIIGEDVKITTIANSGNATVNVNGGAIETINNTGSGNNPATVNVTDGEVGTLINNASSGNAAANITGGKVGTLTIAGNGSAANRTSNVTLNNAEVGNIEVTATGAGPATLTVSGADTVVTGNVTVSGAAAKATVSAGTFAGKFTTENGAETQISGGKFTGETLRISQLAEGKIQNADHEVVDGSYVAEFNDYGYFTLKAAVNAANESTATDRVVKLLANDSSVVNDTVNGRLGIYSDMTLDLGGKTYTLEGDYAVIVGNGATATIKNGNVVANDVALALWEGSNVTLDGVSLTATDDGATAVVLSYPGEAATLTANNSNITAEGENSYGITIWGGASESANTVKLVVNGGTITGGDFAISGNGSSATKYNTEIEIHGGTIKSTDDDGVAIYVPQPAKVTIDESVGAVVISGPDALYAKAGTINISAGTFIGTGAAADYDPSTNGLNPTGAAVVFETNHAYAGVTANISGGTFKSVNTEAVQSFAEMENLIAPEKFISGGTFSSDPVNYLADNFAIYYNGGDTFEVEAEADLQTSDEVKAIVEVAAGKYYATSFAAAWKTLAVGTPATITVVEDITVSDALTIAEGMDVTITTAAGVELTFTDTITNNGTLTIDGAKVAFGNEIANNGTMKAINGAELTIDASSVAVIGAAPQILTNNGTLVVEGATMAFTDVAGHSGINNADGATFTVADGTLTMKLVGLGIDNYGTMTISGASNVDIYADGDNAIANNGLLIISGTDNATALTVKAEAVNTGYDPDAIVNGGLGIEATLVISGNVKLNLNGVYGLNNNQDGTTVIEDGVVVEGSDLYNFENMVISGSTINTGIVNDGTLTIENSVVVGHIEQGYAIDNGTSALNASAVKLTIVGDDTYIKAEIVSANAAYVKLEGGKFIENYNFKWYDYENKHFTRVDVDENNYYWQLVDGGIVAVNDDGEGFGTLQEAIDSAAATQSITLLKDTDENVVITVTNNTNLTLTLASYANGTATDYTVGSITITASAMMDSARIMIEGGSIGIAPTVSTASAAGRRRAPAANTTYDALTIENIGNVELNNVTVNGTTTVKGDGTYVLVEGASNLQSVVADDGALVELFGGNFTGAITAKNGAEIDITDETCVFHNEELSTENGGTIVVEAGTFDNRVDAEYLATSRVCWQYTEGANLDKFTVKAATPALTDAKMVAGVSGTQFNNDDIMPGYVQIEDEEQGIWTILSGEGYAEYLLANLEAYKNQLLAKYVYNADGTAMMEQLFEIAKNNIEEVLSEDGRVPSAEDIAQANAYDATARKEFNDVPTNGIDTITIIEETRYEARIELKKHASDHDILPDDQLVLDGIEAINTAVTKLDILAALEAAIDSISARLVALKAAKEAAINYVTNEAASAGLTNITSAMFTAINTAKTVEEVAQATAIIIDEIDDIAEAKANVADLLEKAEAIVDALGEFDAGDTLYDAIKTANDALDGIRYEDLQEILDAISDVEDNLSEAIDNAVEAIQDLLSDMSDALDEISANVDSIMSTVEDNNDMIVALAEALDDLANDSAVLDAIADLDSRIDDDILAATDNLMDYLQNTVGTILAEIKAKVEENSDKLDDIQEAIDALAADTTVLDAISDLSDKLDEVEGNLSEQMTDVQDALEQAIADATETIEGWLDDLSEKLDELSDNVDDIKFTVEDNNDLLVALAEALDDLAADTTILDAINDLGDDILSATDDLMSYLQNTVVAILTEVQNIVEGNSDKIDTLQDAIDAIAADTAVLDAIADLGDRLDEVEGNLSDKMDEVQGALEEALEEAMEAINDLLGEVKDDLSDLAAEVADIKATAEDNNDMIVALAEALDDLANDTTILEAIEAIDGRIDDEILAAANDLMDYLQNTVADILAEIKAAVEENGNKLDNVQDAIDALAADTAVLEAIADLSEQLYDVEGNLSEQIYDAQEALKDAIEDATETIEGWLKDLNDKLNDVADIVDEIKTTVEDNNDKLVDLAEALDDLANDTTILDAIDDLGDDIISATDELMYYLQDAISDILDAIQATVEDNSGKLDSIKSAIDAMAADTAVLDAIETLSGNLDGAKDELLGKIDDVKLEVLGAIDEAKDELAGLVNGAVTTLEANADKLDDILVALADIDTNFNDGTEGVFALLDGLKDLATGIDEKLDLGNAENISELFDEIAGMIDQAEETIGGKLDQMLDALNDKLDDLGTAIGEVSDKLDDLATADKLDDLAEKVAEVKATLEDEIAHKDDLADLLTSDDLDTIIGAIGDVQDELADALDNALSDLYDDLTDYIDGLDIEGQLSDLFDNIEGAIGSKATELAGKIAEAQTAAVNAANAAKAAAEAVGTQLTQATTDVLAKVAEAKTAADAAKAAADGAKDEILSAIETQANTLSGLLDTLSNKVATATKLEELAGKVDGLATAAKLAELATKVEAIQTTLANDIAHTSDFADLLTSTDLATITTAISNAKTELAQTLAGIATNAQKAADEAEKAAGENSIAAGYAKDAWTSAGEAKTLAQNILDKLGNDVDFSEAADKILAAATKAQEAAEKSVETSEKAAEALAARKTDAAKEIDGWLNEYVDKLVSDLEATASGKANVAYADGDASALEAKLGKVFSKANVARIMGYYDDATKSIENATTEAETNVIVSNFKSNVMMVEVLQQIQNANSSSESMSESQISVMIIIGLAVLVLFVVTMLVVRRLRKGNRA